MTAHIHADTIAAYAVDAKNTDKPWLLWEIYPLKDDRWCRCDACDMTFFEEDEYRRIGTHQELNSDCVTAGLHELMNAARCRLEFNLPSSEWPISGFPAWVKILDVDMPMIKMKSVHGGMGIWINSAVIKTIEGTSWNTTKT